MIYAIVIVLIGIGLIAIRYAMLMERNSDDMD